MKIVVLILGGLTLSYFGATISRSVSVDDKEGGMGHWMTILISLLKEFFTNLVWASGAKYGFQEPRWSLTKAFGLTQFFRV